MRQSAPIHLSNGDIDTRFFSKYNASMAQKAILQGVGKSSQLSQGTKLMTPSAVLAGDPQDVGAAKVVGVPGSDKEEVGEPVDIMQRRGAYPLPFGA
jgi:hypothetical protein